MCAPVCRVPGVLPATTVGSLLGIGAAVETQTEPVTADDPCWTPLIDVTTIPLTQLIGARDSVLSRSILRLVESLEDPHGVLSAFDSFVDS
jgi:FXSXX-COOH protein